MTTCCEWHESKKNIISRFCVMRESRCQSPRRARICVSDGTDEKKVKGDMTWPSLLQMPRIHIDVRNCWQQLANLLWVNAEPFGVLSFPTSWLFLSSCDWWCLMNMLRIFIHFLCQTGNCHANAMDTVEIEMRMIKFGVT